MARVMDIDMVTKKNQTLDQTLTSGIGFMFPSWIDLKIASNESWIDLKVPSWIDSDTETESETDRDAESQMDN